MTAASQIEDQRTARRRGALVEISLPGLLLLLPVLAFLGVFYIAPLTTMIGESFTWWSGDPDAGTGATTYQYVKTFASDRAMGAILRTFRISLLSVLFCLLISYPIALWLLTAGRGLRTAILLITFISLAASLIVRNYGWLIVLSDGGPVNQVLVALGIVEFPLRLNYTEGAIIVALVHYGMPFMILPIYGALLRVPPSLLEASTALGASPLRTLRRVIVPLSMPGVFGGTMLVFAVSMSAFVTPLMLGSPSTAMASQVAAEQLLVQLNFAWGAAIITVLTLATLLVVFLYAVAVRRVFRVDV